MKFDSYYNLCVISLPMLLAMQIGFAVESEMRQVQLNAMQNCIIIIGIHVITYFSDFKQHLPEMSLFASLSIKRNTFQTLFSTSRLHSSDVVISTQQNEIYYTMLQNPNSKTNNRNLWKKVGVLSKFLQVNLQERDL